MGNHELRPLCRESGVPPARLGVFGVSNKLWPESNVIKLYLIPWRSR